MTPRRFGAVLYLTPSVSDSINYQGLNVLLYEGNDLVEVAELPVSLTHRGRLFETLNFSWINLADCFRLKELRVPPRGSRAKTIVVDLEGFALKDTFAIQVVYFGTDGRVVYNSNQVGCSR